MNQEKYRNMNKKRQEYQNQNGETPISSQSARSHEHLNNIKICPIPWTCEFRVVRGDLMSVCVKRNARVYKQGAQNNNKITANIG